MEARSGSGLRETSLWASLHTQQVSHQTGWTKGHSKHSQLLGEGPNWRTGENSRKVMNTCTVQTVGRKTYVHVRTYIRSRHAHVTHHQQHCTPQYCYIHTIQCNILHQCYMRTTPMLYYTYYTGLSTIYYTSATTTWTSAIYYTSATTTWTSATYILH